MTLVPVVIAVAASTVAAAIHGFMFVRESVLFCRPSTLEMFEIQERDAPTVRLWAFHQGIYNLLLGATALTGAIFLILGNVPVAIALIVASSVSMIVASIALIAADRRRVRVPGLLAQSAPAVIALVALALL